MKLSTFLKNQRSQLQLKMSDVSRMTGIAQSLLSKIEAGIRMPTESQVTLFAESYKVSISEVRKLWLADKIYNITYGYPEALEAMQVAESRVEYLISDKALEALKLSDGVKLSLTKLNELKAIWSKNRPLGHTQLSKMREYFNIEYTYESNRIEGNTLTLHETELVVNKGLTISGKPMKDHLEAVNHSEAADYVYDIVKNGLELNKRVLLELHHLVLRGIDRDNAGRYRSVPVRITGSVHEPPQPYLLDKLMEDYFIHYQNQKDRLHPVILAAEMHERLVSIHPFIDGNGRTSRLVMNLILLHHGFTLANLKGDLDSRMEYYKSLEEVQVDANPERFYRLILNSCEQSLNAHIELAG